MGSCLIFCAGALGLDRVEVKPGDFIIAADGGLRHTQGLGLMPDVILGDFDSLGFTPSGSQVFPVEKDDTDSMLALRQALDRGYREIYIYGGLDGGRLDHTVANFQALQFAADRGAAAYLIGERYCVTVLKNEELRFPATAQGILSLFCMGPDATGVTIENLQYPLENGTLTSGFPLGVSNHFMGRDSRISVKNGSLLAMWNRENGLPAQRKKA